MCDLIDLKSPDTKGLLGSKLASPLIPVPMNNGPSECSTSSNDMDGLLLETRDSINNNPFDMVLEDINEYDRKKNDPFEVILEKALKLGNKKPLTFRTGSVGFSDDNTPKKKKNVQDLKMNKTLDEFHIVKELNPNVCKKKIPFVEALKERITSNMDGINSLEENHIMNSMDLCSKNSYNMPVIDIQIGDLSILNQSAMNDTLFETNALCNEMDGTTFSKLFSANSPKMSVPNSTMSILNLPSPKHQRSFSQGDRLSPRKMLHLNRRSRSTLEDLRPNLTGSYNTMSNTVSSISSDPLNKGFLEVQNSTVSSLSSISIRTGLNSLSLNSNSSMSTDTINRAFLESCSSERSDNLGLKQEQNFSMTTSPMLSMPEHHITSKLGTTNQIQSDLSEIEHKLSKLNVTSQQLCNLKINGTQVPRISSNRSNSFNIVSKKETNKQFEVDNKLIDIDVYTPETKSLNEDTKSSISDTSSDSVFLETDKKNTLVSKEAKFLAKTFEDLASKPNSESNADDLISNNTLWMSDLLPAFDDEEVDANLIELPMSPLVITVPVDSDIVQQGSDHKSGVSNDRNCTGSTKVEEHTIKQLETEFIEAIPVEEKINAATLLSDLRKLIKTDDNTEANKLLENLEKALGIECKNNTELLTMYLNATNNLAKSPQKPSSKMNIIENVKEEDMEHSHEENANSAETTAETNLCGDTNMEKFNMDKTNEKNKASFKEMHTGSGCIASPREELNSSDEKVAMQLLVNLGKLLNGQTEEKETLNLLKNLGKVLNFATNNCNFKSQRVINESRAEFLGKPQQRKSKSEKIFSAISAKSKHRSSLGMESKNNSQPSSRIEKILSRSTSGSSMPPLKLKSPTISKSKSASQLKDVKKRCSSDPGFIELMKNKKNSDARLGLIKAFNAKKEAPIKSVPVSEAQQEKSVTLSSSVKNKLKRKVESDVVTKKGPMKAVLPVGSMQRAGTIGKKTISPTGSLTPPRSKNSSSVIKIISSTPNSIDAESVLTKSPKTKPVASSTPDAQNYKMQKAQEQSMQLVGKRNFSCDISPVITHVNISDNNDGAGQSPKRVNKLPSPKRLTPKQQRTNSSIPKYSTSPIIKRNNSFDLHRSPRLSESPQRTLRKPLDTKKSSPISTKMGGGAKIQQSPLKDSNKIHIKPKPFNLISKLRRHSSGNPMEKENPYA
ncbi:hypothetical protein KM043_012411 [Ampulex compressa]|nr:hypothetical protein KM043_012411 [Ampulex compressa]